MVVFEDDLERGEQSRLEVDLVIGRDDRHGQRAQREKPERDERRQKHGARKLRLRLFEFGSVHGVDFDAGEQQQDAREEGDVAHARNVGEQPRMDVVRGVDIDDLADGVRNMLQRDGVAADHPDDRHDDHDDAGQHRADEESLARDARYGRGAAQGDKRGAPVHGDRKQPDEKSVLGEVGHADHVGDRRRGEAEYGGIPDDVLYPLQEDGREAHVFVEGLFDPCVDAAAFRGEGAAQLGAYQRRRDQEQEGGEEDVEEHGKFLLRHHRKPAQTDDGRRSHQRELRCCDVSVFCHNVELWFTPDGQSVSVP